MKRDMGLCGVGVAFWLATVFFVFVEPNLEWTRSIMIFQRIPNGNKRMVLKVAGILSYNKIRECAAKRPLARGNEQQCGVWFGEGTPQLCCCAQAKPISPKQSIQSACNASGRDGALWSIENGLCVSGLRVQSVFSTYVVERDGPRFIFSKWLRVSRC